MCSLVGEDIAIYGCSRTNMIVVMLDLGLDIYLNDCRGSESQLKRLSVRTENLSGSCISVCESMRSLFSHLFLRLFIVSCVSHELKHHSSLSSRVSNVSNARKKIMKNDFDDKREFSTHISFYQRLFYVLQRIFSSLIEKMSEKIIGSFV
jgi:hypothetical protein